MSIQTGLLVTVTLLAGIGIPIMASLNSSLGQHLGSPIAAGLILFLLAFTVTAIVFVFKPSAIPISSVKLPWYYYIGGVFVAFYVLSITWTAPKLGVTNAIFIVLLGQIISSVVIEHFALFNSAQTSISFQRVLGICLMLLGIVLSRRPIYS